MGCGSLHCAGVCTERTLSLLKQMVCLGFNVAFIESIFSVYILFIDREGVNGGICCEGAKKLGVDGGGGVPSEVHRLEAS